MLQECGVGIFTSALLMPIWTQDDLTHWLYKNIYFSEFPYKPWSMASSLNNIVNSEKCKAMEDRKLQILTV